MTIRLVDEGWDKEIIQALEVDSSNLLIISPFIKTNAVERILSLQPSKIQVITRFNLADFSAGVSDIAALRKLLNAKARIRGVRNLHAKLYLFGVSRTIITSANLTEAALSRNHELGLVTEDSEIIAKCRAYFRSLWKRAGKDLTYDNINDWTETVTKHHLRGGRPNESSGLKDFGRDVGMAYSSSDHMPMSVADATQAFIKLLGKADNRVPITSSTIQEIENSDCHWAVCYPTNKRPRSVRDGAVIFMGRLTRNPNDIQVFGRAIGIRYEQGRDDATEADFARRSWMKDWSRFIRVHDAEFVAGTLENGVSLKEMMDSLKSQTFASTQRNAILGKGNTNPRTAYSQQPAVKLSNDGKLWLCEQLEAKFEAHGKIPQNTLGGLYWPDY